MLRIPTPPHAACRGRGFEHDESGGDVPQSQEMLLWLHVCIGIDWSHSHTSHLRAALATFVMATQVAECVRRVTPAAPLQSAPTSIGGGGLLCVPEGDDKDGAAAATAASATTVGSLLPDVGPDGAAGTAGQSDGPTVTTVTVAGITSGPQQRPRSVTFSVPELAIAQDESEPGSPVATPGVTPGAGGAFASLAAQHAATGGAFGSFLDTAGEGAVAARAVVGDLEASLGSISLASRSTSAAANGVPCAAGTANGAAVTGQSQGVNESQPQGLEATAAGNGTGAVGSVAANASGLPVAPRQLGGLSAALNEGAAAGNGSLTLSAALAASRGARGGYPGLAGLSPRDSITGGDMGNVLHTAPAAAGLGVGPVDAEVWPAVVHGLHALNATRRRLAGTLAFWAALLQDPQGVCHLAAPYGVQLNQSGALNIGALHGALSGRMGTPLARCSWETGIGGNAAEGGSFAPPSTVGSHGGSGMLVPAMSVGGMSGTPMSIGAAGPELQAAAHAAVGGAVAGGGGLFGITPAVQRLTMASQLESETASGGEEN